MSKECEHCWHHTGLVLASMPPLDQFVCCRCGQKKTEQRLMPDSQSFVHCDEDHGPFTPRWNITFSDCPEEGGGDDRE